ncbi:MAG: DEAD/DEAH box helicase family protein [Proteobacteria bacterium]|jgi:type I restriction enzyme R subunit|nr:DEAD/DEAH box helicase family protein [Pseudomonadota bacterium]
MQEDKKKLSEADICLRYLTPALEGAGWDKTQIRSEYQLTDGRVIVRGKLTARGVKKRADYALFYKPGLPLAVVEAKDNTHTVGSGMQQALGYAAMLDVPFVFSSNGDRFLFHDATAAVLGGLMEEEIALDRFPSPQFLYERWKRFKNLSPEREKIVAQDYHIDASGRVPRYYQIQAINRTVEAVANGQDRILLVMATGSGKTYVAFQIIWRLWKADRKKRILFLADRNILVDDPKTKDFKPFSKVMTKIANRKVDTSYEVYLALYQAVSGTEEEKDVYKQFSPGFFDLIVVDECHRSSAAEASAWHDILDYFSSATHIGLTATPKETKDVSNLAYFGEPVFTYSLKQGIEDGFLAPYKVVRIDFDKDLTGWRPEAGKLDKLGQEIEDRVYNQRDFDRTLVLEKRTRLVAEKVTRFLKESGDRFAKTIVFCEDIDHAERMRQELVNLNADLVEKSSKYVMRITGDSVEGKQELGNFIEPTERYPVIATTSKLMSTGVDAQTCKLIVLDQRIQSMTEFKQIIGRGTRIREDYDKLWFTIMDFKKATELFADPSFDGDPVQIYVPPADGPIVPPDIAEGHDSAEGSPVGVGEDLSHLSDPSHLSHSDPDRPRRQKYVVGDVKVSVVAERVQYYGADGKLITESLKDYTKKRVKTRYASLDSFLKTWTGADRKRAIIEELEQQGVFFEALADEVGREVEPFDLVCHVAFGAPPLTRRERAENVKKRHYWERFGEQARAVLGVLLEKYANEGIENIEDPAVLNVKPLSDFGTPVKIVKLFGGKDGFDTAVRELEREIYSA